MMALQVADTYKARVLDETQSNQYVMGASRGKRAQYETHRYLQRLAEPADEAPAADGPTSEAPANEAPAERAVS
jgi:hypothetical protein